MKVEWGSLVRLEYNAFLDSGEQIDSSEVNGLLEIRVGTWDVLPGLGAKLVGLREGDERLIRLTPPEAFGDWEPDAVLTIRESLLVGDVILQEGMTVQIETHAGPSAVCRVYRVMEDQLTLDFNHPLAGEALTLFVRVLIVAQPALPRAAAVW